MTPGRKPTIAGALIGALAALALVAVAVRDYFAPYKPAQVQMWLERNDG